MIENDSVKIDRKRLVIKPNAIVGYKGSKYKVINILSSDDVVLSNLESPRSIQARISDLTVIDLDDNTKTMLDKGEDISEEAWQIALSHYDVIKPLIENSTVETVKQIAQEHNLHVNTVWRWLKTYRENKSILALVPKNVVGRLKERDYHQNLTTLFNKQFILCI